MRNLLMPSIGSALLLMGCAGTGVTYPNLKNADVPNARGTLVLPEGAGPFPAVVIVHGCNGIGPNAEMWARFLKANGYASLVLDSFGPRGMWEVCTDQRRLFPQQRVNDTYAALRYLSTRPEIAAGRVAIIGFSHGGSVALDAAGAFWNQSVTETSVRFRAAIALYPGCRGRVPNYRIPVLILIGDKDDWTPPWSCEGLVRELDRSSAPIDLRIYPGGLHGFDDVTSGAYRPNVQNPSSPTGYGATVGGDPRLLERAKADVLGFLAKHVPGR